MFEGRRWWIVGASEGLGRALAEALAAEGARLILSARNTERLEALAATLPEARALPMDVTDPESVARAVAGAGGIDGIIYAAGAYRPMAAPDWDRDSAETIAEVNFMGALRVLRHVAPALAARRAGTIVLIGSLAGFRGLPGAIGYGASKAALMNLGESLHGDLRRAGVRVRIASPGFIETRLTARNDFPMPQIMPPERAARHVIRIIRGRRVHVAFPRPFAWLFTWGRFLPAALFTRLTGG